MKKAQADIVTFAVVVIVLIIIAPVLLKIVTSSVGGFVGGLNVVDNRSANTVAVIQNQFTSFWDIIIVSAMFASIILMLVTSFLVPVHPIFIFLYIITCFLTMVFMPQLIQIANGVWGASGISDVSIHLPITQFIMEYYPIILLAVMIITGIIMYSKAQGGQQTY